jgi:hypothetical protein
MATSGLCVRSHGQQTCLKYALLGPPKKIRDRTLWKHGYGVQVSPSLWLATHTGSMDYVSTTPSQHRRIADGTAKEVQRDLYVPAPVFISSWV